MNNLDNPRAPPQKQTRRTQITNQKSKKKSLIARIREQHQKKRNTDHTQQQLPQPHFSRPQKTSEHNPHTQ